jgi:hypothetical protein
VAHIVGRKAHRIAHELGGGEQAPSPCGHERPCAFAGVGPSTPLSHSLRFRLGCFQDDKVGVRVGRGERGFSMMELQKQMRPRPATRAALLSRTF